MRSQVNFAAGPRAEPLRRAAGEQWSSAGTNERLQQRSGETTAGEVWRTVVTDDGELSPRGRRAGPKSVSSRNWWFGSPSDDLRAGLPGGEASQARSGEEANATGRTTGGSSGKAVKSQCFAEIGSIADVGPIGEITKANASAKIAARTANIPLPR